LDTPNKHAARNGGPRARETPEGQAQPLHEADDAGLTHADIVRAGRERHRRWPSLAKPRGQDQQPGGRESRGDELEMAEKILDLGVRHALERRLLQDLDDDLADDSSHDGRQHDTPRNGLERGNTLEVRAAPLAPEIGDDGEHGAGMQHHQEQRHRRRGRVEPEELLGDDHVRGARYRQKLRQALNDG
jgi:hypothetical protein